MQSCDKLIIYRGGSWENICKESVLQCLRTSSKSGWGWPDYQIESNAINLSCNVGYTVSLWLSYKRIFGLNMVFLGSVATPSFPRPQTTPSHTIVCSPLHLFFSPGPDTRPWTKEKERNMGKKFSVTRVPHQQCYIEQGSVRSVPKSLQAPAAS